MRSLKQAGRYVVTVSVLVLVAAVPLVSGQPTTPPSGVPEIDGSSISAGLGLLAAGVLMLRARRSK